MSEFERIFIEPLRNDTDVQGARNRFEQLAKLYRDPKVAYDIPHAIETHMKNGERVTPVLLTPEDPSNVRFAESLGVSPEAIRSQGSAPVGVFPGYALSVEVISKASQLPIDEQRRVHAERLSLPLLRVHIEPIIAG